MIFFLNLNMRLSIYVFYLAVKNMYLVFESWTGKNEEKNLEF